MPAWCVLYPHPAIEVSGIVRKDGQLRISEISSNGVGLDFLRAHLPSGWMHTWSATFRSNNNKNKKNVGSLHDMTYCTPHGRPLATQALVLGSHAIYSTYPRDPPSPSPGLVADHSQIKSMLWGASPSQVSSSAWQGSSYCARTGNPHPSWNAALLSVFKNTRKSSNPLQIQQRSLQKWCHGQSRWSSTRYR